MFFLLLSPRGTEGSLRLAVVDGGAALFGDDVLRRAAVGTKDCVWFECIVPSAAGLLVIVIMGGLRLACCGADISNGSALQPELLFSPFSIQRRSCSDNSAHSAMLYFTSPRVPVHLLEFCYNNIVRILADY